MTQWIATDGAQLLVSNSGDVLFDENPLPGTSVVPVPHLKLMVCCAPTIEHTSISLREYILQADTDSYLKAATAAGVVEWAASHRFCPRCGKPTHRLRTELAMACSHCRYRSYPRVSPCIIVIVTRGDEILLGYHRRHKSVLYSALAGFVETGENAEQAVAREVFEEAGVEVGRCRYLASQAWPFPSQLMLAFQADYKEGFLQPDAHELQDLQWFDYRTLPAIPPEGTIAGMMIREWVAARAAQ